MNAARLSMAVACLAALALPSLADAGLGFYDGYELKKFADADDRVERGNGDGIDVEFAARLLGYVTGVADTATGVICDPPGVPASQMVLVVKKYIRENPDTWNKAGKDIVIDALSSTFPCE